VPDVSTLEGASRRHPDVTLGQPIVAKPAIRGDGMSRACWADRIRVLKEFVMRGIQTAAAAALLLSASVVAAASFSAKQVSITINGQQAHFRSVGGLSYENEVVAKDKPPALTLRIDANVDAATFGWIKSSWTTPYTRRTAVIRRGTQAVTFRDSRITEVRFPALDKRSKTPAYLQLKVQPGRGKLSTIKATSTAEVKAKKWLPSAYTFELGNLPASRVMRVDSFTVKSGVVEDQVGKFKEPTKHPAKVEVPNLKITFSAADAQLKKFQADGTPLRAKLTLTDTNGKPWARVVMSQVKVITLRPGTGQEVKATVSVGSAALTR
jgi:hypothetical protein